MHSNDMVKTIYHALDDKKAKDIVIMNIQNVSMIADYFVIASGENQNQMQAMADNAEEEMTKKDCYFRHMEGYPNTDWILMDYNDVIVHIFNKESRIFYDLDRIWRDALIVTVDQL
ncbi:Ribosomal silencing factor RsfS [Clostridiales bacterium CHKCI001]|nr:Ribosomal silencing factor RsfS [Clostridiales bacterium CHKCI001]